jgi:hypothetical protein
MQLPNKSSKQATPVPDNGKDRVVIVEHLVRRHPGLERLRRLLGKENSPRSEWRSNWS